MRDANPQLNIYGLAALREYSLAQDFKTVRTIIVQPRLGHVSERVQTVEELEEFGLEVMGAAAATTLADAPRVPSEKGCRWCKAKANCKALADEVWQDTHDGSGPATLGDFDDLTVADANHIAVCANDWLGARLAKVDLIEGWCKAIRAEVEKRLLAGESVRGYKLVQGKRGNRQWSSKDVAEDALKKMRVPHDQMYSYTLVSPTKAEELAKAGVIGPRQWPKLQALITQSEGSPSVAPENDKRPALVKSAVDDDFADLTESLS